MNAGSIAQFSLYIYIYIDILHVFSQVDLVHAVAPYTF